MALRNLNSFLNRLAAAACYLLPQPTNSHWHGVQPAATWKQDREKGVAPRLRITPIRQISIFTFLFLLIELDYS